MTPLDRKSQESLPSSILIYLHANAAGAVGTERGAVTERRNVNPGQLRRIEHGLKSNRVPQFEWAEFPAEAPLHRAIDIVYRVRDRGRHLRRDVRA